VPEHDAFGRPIGEDPLAELREATEARPVEAAEARPAEPAAARPVEPAVAAVRASPAAPTAVFVRPRRRRGGIVILLAMAIVFVAAVPVVVGVIATGVRDEIEGVLPDAVETTAPPAGLGRGSLIRAESFAPALAILREADLGRPVVLRVAPDRIDATLAAGGQINQVQVTADGELRRFSSTDTGTTPPTIRFDRIDPRAPERLVRRGARRADVPASRISYLVLNPGPGHPWGAYFDGGAIVQGDARGRPRRVL
jgi:hypothetical protein